MNEQTRHPPESSTPPTSMEHIGPHVTREWLDGGRIVIFNVTSIAWETIDAWAEAAIALLDGWPADRPHLVMHDVSAPDLTLTPYIRKRAQDVADAHFNVKGRTAVIAPRGAGGFLLRTFVNFLRVQKTGREQKIFFTREDGLAWLREALAD